MSKAGVTAVTIGLVVAGIVAAWGPIHRSGARRIRPRAAVTEKQEESDGFAARFDSLTDARLLPTVWRLGTFVKTGFNEDRTEWTLVVSPADWSRRNETAKRDLAATLLSSLEAIRAQAGGDPSRASLVIKDDTGRAVAKASHATGVEVMK
jgi:hypothetical protein